MKTSEAIDLVVSFDTTGSMYPALTQVRRNIEALVKRMFKEVPDLRVGIIAHGDYCDAGDTYVTKILDLTNNEDKICNFVKTVERTFGGDAPECYELVLHQSRSLSWRSGKSKVLAVIGDDVPHGPKEPQNKKKLDWRNEIDLLLEAGVNVYGVQALGRSHATAFYQEIAKKTGGFHLTLDQFSELSHLILAVAFKQEGEKRLLTFEEEISKAGRMNRSMENLFTVLTGKAPKAAKSPKKDLQAVPPHRFQVMEVDRDVSIPEFVREQGLAFNTGRGFYQFGNKRVTIQDYKEIVLRDKKTGDMFTGPYARKLMGLPTTGTVDLSPKDVDTGKYDAFVQSTSPNRKLFGDTLFLYEVDGWE